MPISPHAERPLVFGKDGGVVVDREGQVVRDEIFAGGAHVHGVEVVEFAFHCVCFGAVEIA